MSWYNNGSVGKGLYFSSYSSLELIMYADADWASCPGTILEGQFHMFLLVSGSSLVSSRCN